MENVQTGWTWLKGYSKCDYRSLQLWWAESFTVNNFSNLVVDGLQQQGATSGPTPTGQAQASSTGLVSINYDECWFLLRQHIMG